MQEESIFFIFHEQENFLLDFLNSNLPKKMLFLTGNFLFKFSRKKCNFLPDSSFITIILVYKVDVAKISTGTWMST
jgi:hypothetical protein